MESESRDSGARDGFHIRKDEYNTETERARFVGWVKDKLLRKNR